VALWGGLGFAELLGREHYVKFNLVSVMALRDHVFSSPWKMYHNFLEEKNCKNHRKQSQLLGI
jgi:hypothetical protein